jgi:hypothetical protein
MRADCRRIPGDNADPPPNRFLKMKKRISQLPGSGGVKEEPMRDNRILARTAWWLSLFLGQASLLFGMMIALGWTLAFALILPQKGNAWMAGPRIWLPIEPPLIGLAIGALGFLIARWSHEPVARFSVAGMIFNTLSLALALLSIAACSAR